MATLPLYKEGTPSHESTSSDDPKVVVLNKQINTRVSEEDISELDRLIAKLEKETPGLKLSRSEVARIALLEGLKSLLGDEDVSG